MYELFKLIAEKERINITDLAKASGKSLSSTSETVSALKENGLVSVSGKRTKYVNISKEPHAALLKELLDEYPWLSKYLKGKKYKIIRALANETKLADIAATENISYEYTANVVDELASRGAISKEGELLSLSKPFENIRKYTELYELRGAPVHLGKILWKKGSELLIETKKDLNYALTGFSRYSDYGVELISPTKTYYYPKKELGIEEIFVHSLASIKGSRDVVLAIIFFLRYKNKLNFRQLRQLAVKFEVLEILENVLKFIGGKEVKDKRFPTFVEFEEKAKMYGFTPRKKFGIKPLLDLLKNVGRTLETKIDIYMIGGGALALRGLKRVTKDIDIVIPSKKKAFEFIRLLEKQDYQSIKEIPLEYKNLNAIILRKEKFPQIDIFTQRICDSLVFTQSMQKRAKLHKKLGKVNLYIVSNEDIFLFKSITERLADLEDCRDLLTKHELDWETIFKECGTQEEATKVPWSLFLLDHVELLEIEYGLDLSRIKQKLEKVCLKSSIMLLLGKKPMNIRELKEYLKFEAREIRTILTKLEKTKKIRVDRSGKLNVYKLRSMGKKA